MNTIFDTPLEIAPIINTPQTISKSDKQDNKQGPVNKDSKQSNNTQKKKNTPQKHGGKRSKASFDKKPETKVASVRPLDNYFEINITLDGITHLAEIFYGMLRSRDSKMTALFTELEFRYVLTMSVLYRLATIANYHHSAFIGKLSDLKTLAHGLLLPDVIATYVETFGIVTLQNGAKVIPFFRGYQHVRRHMPMADLNNIVQMINMYDLEEYETQYWADPDDWGLCDAIVLKYSKACSRALKNAIELRPVKYDEYEGRPEFLSCYKSNRFDTHVECLAIDKIDSQQCQLGASYRLRTHETLRMNGTYLPPLFGTDSVRPDVFLVNHFNKAWRT